MTQIVPHLFQPEMSEVQMYRAVNDMGVDYITFAHNTSYFARMFGVLTGAVEGGDFGDFVVNSCLRNALWRTLYSVNEDTERYLGYNLSPRYHEDAKTSWRIRYQVWPGVDEVNVRETISNVVITAMVSPYVQENATIQTHSGQQCVLVDGDVIFNPNEVTMRSSLDGGVIPTLLRATFPRRSGDDWLIPINTQTHPIQVGEQVHIQSRKYVYVDITPVTVANGSLLPVYPGTTQKIPLARPVQALENGKHRYWFWIYSLVDPEFYDDTEIDLVNGQFYKLHQAVEFRHFIKETVYGRLQQHCPQTDKTRAWKVELQIVDAERGVVQANILGEWVVNPQTEVEELKTTRCSVEYCAAATYNLTLYYTTDPNKLPSHVRQSLASVRKAILHRVAADLPLKDCGCEVNTGFIAAQQVAYNDAVVLSNGAKLIRLRYGDLHGHAVYEEAMTNAATMKAGSI